MGIISDISSLILAEVKVWRGIISYGWIFKTEIEDVRFRFKVDIHKESYPNMELKNCNNEAAKLSILGYQFPEAVDDDYDSNWLRVHGEITHEKGSWKFVDACLLTYEAAELASWLEELGRNKACKQNLGFIEPNLDFRLTEQKSLRLYFELEARPNWAPWDGAGLEDLWIDFELDELSLCRAAKSLREELKQYPQRTKY